MYTPYHSKYWAASLTCKGAAGSVDSLSRRTTEDIQAAFDKLRADLDAEIGARMADTHKVLLENFDEDVRARLRIRNDEAHAVLSERQRWLHCLAVQELPAQPDEG